MSTETRRRFERTLRELASDEAAGPHEIVIEYTADPREAILRHTAEADLVVMGMQARGRGPFSLGELPLAIARESQVPLVLITRRPVRSRGLTRLPLPPAFRI
jgi:nucleotide-binding universal stress UspA family protein